jgi:aspartate aminotransferase
VQLLEKQHVAVVPGSAFGTAEHIRISYATSLEQLERGIGRIAEFMGSLGG